MVVLRNGFRYRVSIPLFYQERHQYAILFYFDVEFDDGDLQSFLRATSLRLECVHSRFYQMTLVVNVLLLL
jgi:hypothetical protein